uniref:Uncharacterized protein LOC111109231 n=1 Tax=Crassostrea virginica TaxID=6565 RepID=A0A8B8BC70_CRAVI|nr:uncharacterized protein LOC111109231 [Crassostrea virginica]
MKEPYFLWSSFLLILLADISSGASYFPWQQPKHNRSTLMCPNTCLTDYILESDQLSCCCCRARPIWNISPTWPYRQVDIEYTSRRGGGRAVYNANDVSRNISKLIHTAGFLTVIPDNICQFADDLVEVDLSQNRIAGLFNVNCLQRLDTLILKNNRITSLSNVTLIGMTELRSLDLSNNLLTSIDPTAISDPSLGMLNVNFKENSLATIDITNIAIESPFCIVDYSNNDVKKIVNEIGWMVDKDKDYGEGGYVDFSENAQLVFPDVKSLGFEDIVDFGKFYSFGFDFRNVNFSCDCKMQPFLEMSMDAIKKIWRNYFEVTCAGPPALQGVSIIDLMKSDRLDDLMCDLGVEDRCPFGCLCFHQPSKRRVVVDCSNTSKTDLPISLPPSPDGSLLELVFNSNTIKEFNERSYLNHTRTLDMDNNDLSKISNGSLWNSSAIERLLFRNNSKLQKIPRSLKKLHPCNVSFGDLYLHCTCDILWLHYWANSPKAMMCPGNNNFFCITDDGKTLPSSSWTKDNLNCPDNWAAIGIAVAFAVSSLVLGVGFWLLYHYRYEVYLLIRWEKKDGIVTGSKYFDFDVYVSFNEKDPQLFSWIYNQLEPKLNACGYSLCIPCRDLPPGSSKPDAILEYLQKSKKFLFVVDEAILDSEDASIWLLQEWRISWHIFESEKLRNIAVVNYDQIRLKDIDHRQIQAFLRLGLDVDFSNRKGKIFDEILERLNLNYSPYIIDVHPRAPKKPLYSLPLRRCDTPKKIIKFHLFSPDEYNSH